jgi:hypothetical protein
MHKFGFDLLLLFWNKSLALSIWNSLLSAIIIQIQPQKIVSECKGFEKKNLKIK